MEGDFGEGLILTRRAKGKWHMKMRMKDDELDMMDGGFGGSGLGIILYVCR